MASFFRSAARELKQKYIPEETEDFNEAAEISHQRFMRVHEDTQTVKIHTKRADKQGVIVRTINPITRQSISYVKKASTGGIDMVESDFNDAEVDNSSYKKYKSSNRPNKVPKPVGQIDELSKATLGRYINRSADDLKDTQGDIVRSGGINGIDYRALSRVRKNRKAGIATAVKKLVKEETSVDEAFKAHVS